MYIMSPAAVTAQTDLDALFAPPTQHELDAAAADWAARDVTPSQYAAERTGASNGFSLAEVRHEIDGLTHYGVIRYPRHHEAGGKFPVLVLLHGGFDGLDLNWVLTFDEDFPDACLADSFLVVAPTFRGEMLNGYGILPTRWSDGEPSPFDYDCDDSIALLSAVLANEPTADTQRVTAFGGSRGGNVAYHLALRDPRVIRTVIRYGPAEFRLDHVRAGVEQKLDTGETSDRLGELVFEHIADPYMSGVLTLEDARHVLLSWSAAPHLRKTLSLQFHHGAQDDVVPVLHSIEVDAVMTWLGAGAPEYAYYEYPLGGHDPFSLPGHEALAEAYLCEMLTATGVSAPAPSPLHLRAAPNPFAGTVEIFAALPSGDAKVFDTPTTLEIYDARGRCVRTLPLAARSAGRAVAGWDGRDEAGREAPAGVYFATLAGRSTTPPLRLTRLR